MLARGESSGDWNPGGRWGSGGCQVKHLLGRQGSGRGQALIRPGLCDPRQVRSRAPSGHCFEKWNNVAILEEGLGE